MSFDSALAHHYRQLLGLIPPCNITSLDLDANEEQLDITIEWPEKNSRYLWLRRPERWSEAKEEQYRDIARDFGVAKLVQSKLGRAWAIKEAFRGFWGYVYSGWAKRYFSRWYFWATHSRIPQVITVARTLKERLDGLLNYFHHGITNAFAEGINSKIQDLKSATRGFRSFENYSVAILFSCGRLSMQP